MKKKLKHQKRMVSSGVDQRKIFAIYKVINTNNGKIYVGKQKYDYPRYMGSGILIQRAIKKYGESIFSKTILENCLSERDMNSRERFWIKRLKSKHPSGYNISSGGDGGDYFTNNPNKEALRTLMSFRSMGPKNPMFGAHHTEASKRLISKNRKGIGLGVSPHNLGKQASLIAKLRMSIAHKGPLSSTSNSYLFIAPNGTKTKVVGEFDKFCIENKLTPTTARYYVGKGVIPQGRATKNGKRRNLTGWKISTTRSRGTGPESVHLRKVDGGVHQGPGSPVQDQVDSVGVR